MTERRVRVSASLYRRALSDAIDWTESFLASHDPVMGGGGASCCKPGDRCEAYRHDAEWLRRYKRAQVALDGPKEPDPPGRTVTVAELLLQDGETVIVHGDAFRPVLRTHFLHFHSPSTISTCRSQTCSPHVAH